MSYQETFKRYELKYMIDPVQYTEIMKYIKKNLIPDLFGKTTIYNVYYDTPKSELIRYSLEKNAFKEKLRLRSYGFPSDNSTVFIEMKRKYDGIVYKRRIGMQFKDAIRFLNDDIVPSDMIMDEGVDKSFADQVISEIRYFKNVHHPLVPKMQIIYDRCAFFGRTDPDLRITFDNNIQYVVCEEGNKERTSVIDGQYRLMELKVAESIPLDLARLMSKNKINQTSFSKYGHAYEQDLENEIKCKSNEKKERNLNQVIFA